MNVAAVSHFVDDAIVDRRGARHAADGVLVDHGTVGGDDLDDAARHSCGPHPLVEQCVGLVEGAGRVDLGRRQGGRGSGLDRESCGHGNGARRVDRTGWIARYVCTR